MEGPKRFSGRPKDLPSTETAPLGKAKPQKQSDSHPAQPLDPPQSSGNSTAEVDTQGLVPRAPKTAPKRFIRQQVSPGAWDAQSRARLIVSTGSALRKC